MSNYPTALDSFTTKQDNVDDILAAHVNDLQDAIEALETKLGIDSSAVNTTIDYFLRHISGAFRTHHHDGTSDDGSDSIGPLAGLTIANNVDLGNYFVRALQFYPDATTGTAPLVIDSTTLVSNLNADKVDSLDSTDIVQMTGNQTIAGIKTFSSFPVTPSSAPSTDYQVANKKYADDNKSSFGSWDTKTNNTVYQAATDGIVCCQGIGQLAAPRVITDSVNPPTTIRISGFSTSDQTNHTWGLTCPVKKGDYWKTEYCNTVFWIPLGT